MSGAVAAVSVAGAVPAQAAPAGAHPAAPSAGTAAVSGLPASVPPAALRAEPTLPTPAGWPFADAFSRTSGTGRLSGGESYWSDWVYDDRGASSPVAIPTNVQSDSYGDSLAPAQGGYTYGNAAAHNNGADIFRSAVGLTSTTSYWRVDWNTLTDPSVPIAEWTFDTDGNAATGASAWPAQARVRSWLSDLNGHRFRAETVSMKVTVRRSTGAVIAALAVASLVACTPNGSAPTTPVAETTATAPTTTAATDQAREQQTAASASAAQASQAAAAAASARAAAAQAAASKAAASAAAKLEAAAASKATAGSKAAPTAARVVRKAAPAPAPAPHHAVHHAVLDGYITLSGRTCHVDGNYFVIGFTAHFSDGSTRVISGMRLSGGGPDINQLILTVDGHSQTFLIGQEGNFDGIGNCSSGW